MKTFTEYRQDQISKNYSKNKEYIRKRGIKRISNDMSKLLIKNNYIPTIKKGDSYYIDVFSPFNKDFDINRTYHSKELLGSREVDFVATIRISDHVSPSGGGYNQGTGYGHGDPDIYIDPQNGIDPNVALSKIVKIAKENDSIPFK